MLLTAAAAGETTAEEAEKVLMALGVEVLRPFGDPIWRDEWGAAHERERRENAAQYGLAEPARTFFGSPEGTEDREVRDLTRPLGLSPIDVIRWTRQGMPCLRLSPYVRWDAQRVSDWLAERGIVPTRHPILDLDATERFVCRAVASGEATPDEAHEVLSGWYGIM
jgi:hypothetical protein